MFYFKKVLLQQMVRVITGHNLFGDNAVVNKNTEDSNYIVAIPYKIKKSIKETSAITLVFDKEKDFLRYQELVVENQDSSSVTYRYYIDNEETATGTTPISEGEISAQGWLSCMNTCLANQGLSNWAIGVFAALCGATCGTIILCAACMKDLYWYIAYRL
ncbi:hypothetical protein [Bacillus subtilis]|uniref:hypothetical protein n=1 Tax=Bacillus subtilis TaxID=1423 RepID=UPI00214A169E|nr:hypothetical protein [Bacillus subtilis]